MLIYWRVYIIVHIIDLDIQDIHVREMGLSENSVPLHPMVLLIIIPFLNGYFIGNINPTFSDKPKYDHQHCNFREPRPFLQRGSSCREAPTGPGSLTGEVLGLRIR